MMRGQATPIQSVPSEAILRSPTTDKPSNKLPSYLQSLHNLQPARPSKVSSGLGSDVRSDLSVKPNTWKLPDLSSLHNVGRTRNQPKLIAKLVFFRRHSVTELTVPHPTGAEHHASRLAARPERSDAKHRDSVRTK
jgi:hypothetical protein